MRRVLGTTGIPQAVPSILSTQRPILDLTSARTQESIGDRAVYVDLWLHLVTEGWALNATAPSWWTGMTGSSPNFSMTADQAAYVLVSDKNRLQAAVASDAHIIVAEPQGPAAPVAEAISQNGSAMYMNAPIHVLERFTMNAGEALFVVHNYDTTLLPPVMPLYAWGYWELEGEVDGPRNIRPLQPDVNTSPTTFAPVLAHGTDAFTVHTVADDAVDEITLDLRVGAYSGTKSSTGSGGTIHQLAFGDGTTMYPFAGGCYNYVDGSANLPADTDWIRWFDGIPMTGAGAIQLQRIEATGASYARGYFRRR